MNPSYLLSILLVAMFFTAIFVILMFLESSFFAEKRTSVGRYCDEQKDLINQNYVIVFKTTDNEYKRVKVTMEEYYEYTTDEDTLITEVFGKFSKHVYRSFVSEITEEMEGKNG